MATRQDRIWLLGGVFAMILLIVGGWFLLISPQNAETRDAQNRVDAGDAQLAVLTRQAAVLKAETAQLPAYSAKLAANLRAMPTTSGVPDFLRQLQDSGAAVGVEITGINVGGPQPSTAVPAAFELPISLVVEGRAGNLSKFLNRLQNVQPRAVLLSSVGLTSTTGEAMTAAISLKAFVSPPTATPAATPS
jgi:Tfp pilus assembly protein PilO